MTPHSFVTYISGCTVKHKSYLLCERQKRDKLFYYYNYWTRTTANANIDDVN